MQYSLFRRDGTVSMSHTMIALLIVLLVLLLATVLLVSILLFLRQRRRSRQAQVHALDVDKRLSVSTTQSSHRRVTVRPSQSIHIIPEKRKQSTTSSEPPSPTSSLPEIRITFPEEIDASGKRTSGRVVVVHVGDHNVGLEPVSENLPAYQQREGGRFHSIDIERIGGLVEKERTPMGWR